MSKRTVIIGGVAGGMSAATRLRRNDEDREIIVLEASGHVSFANCGLPYHIGGVIPERASLLLQTPQSLKNRFNVDVRVNTRATYIDREAKIVQTDAGDNIRYDELILTPGATPVLPPIDGIETALTLRTVEDMDAIVEATTNAQHVAVIGGGFIGVELAENLRHRGMQVTLVEASPQVMGLFDPEMAILVQRRLEDNGVTVRTRAQATAINNGQVTLADGTTIDADVTVAAIGMRPSTQLAEDAGLEVGLGIVVDEFLRTSDPSIYALGDAVEKRDAFDGSQVLVPLAQTANRHGRLVADIITGRQTKAMPVLGTSILGVFGLQAAAVGWNEKRAGKDVRVIHIHPANHAGYYPGAAQLHMKLIVDPDTDRIMGAQVIGESGADKRIDVIATAMRADLIASDLADLELAYAPQFGSAKDPINFVGFVNDNIVAGEKSVQWHELDERMAGGATLVDVRSAAEYAAGAIPGSVNIPLDDIRERKAEFESMDDIIVHCQVGLRGHLATTLLHNLGIEASNLDGGYLTWTDGKASQQ